MNIKTTSAVFICLALAMAAPVSAAKKSKGGSIKGLFCSQGGNNAFIPAAELKPKFRNSLRKGQKFKFNYPGFGPIDCKAY